MFGIAAAAESPGRSDEQVGVVFTKHLYRGSPAGNPHRPAPRPTPRSTINLGPSIDETHGRPPDMGHHHRTGLRDYECCAEGRPQTKAARLPAAREFIDEKARRHESHPWLLETLADFTENDKQAIRIYKRALRLATMNALPRQTILLELGRRTLEIAGRRRAASRYLTAALAEAKRRRISRLGRRGGRPLEGSRACGPVECGCYFVMRESFPQNSGGWPMDAAAPYDEHRSPRIRHEILSDASEDYHGLYEVIWGLNSRYPDVPETAKIAASIPIMADLIETGLVELYQTTRAPRQYAPNSFEVARGAVRDQRSLAATVRERIG